MRRKHFIKIRNVFIALGLLILAGVMLGGCVGEKDNYANAGELIFKIKVSPNEDYVDNKTDIVDYEIKVFQDKNNCISVFADSNSAFFEALQYQVPFDQPISKDNIEVEWTTLMGNERAAEDDQFAVADVKLSSPDGVFSQRKINFVKGAVEIIIDTIDRKG